MNSIDVIILAGGLGTRLKPIVSNRPKVMATIAGKPFLSILLNQINKAGFKRVILCTGYMADQVEIGFGQKYMGLSLIYSRENRPLGTGGALSNAFHLISSDKIMVMNGDSFIDIDPSLFLRWFVCKGCDAALVLKKVNNSSRYGLVNVDANGLITAFQEKNTVGGSGWVNAGVYIFNKEVIRKLPQGKTFSIEQEFFPSLVGREFYGYCSEAKFTDIGLPESYLAAEGFFAC
jgi:NDP-sugar pyrophosphorylase family protein